MLPNLSSRGMNRSGNDAFAQLVRKHQERNPRFKTRIQHVSYVKRRIKVSGRGYSGPRQVAVQQGIDLGTSDRPKVVQANIAIIEHTDEGKWICVAIRTKSACQVNPSDDEVEVEFDTVSSYAVQGYGASLTPLDLFVSPIETLGQLTPPLLRFPNPTQYLCGIPQCTDCSPSGYETGMAIILSVDDEHPGGCWIWDFRQASCPLFFEAQEALPPLDPGNTGSSFDVGNPAVSVSMRGKFLYVIREGNKLESDDSIFSGKFYVYDLTDPDAPSLVFNEDLPAAAGMYIANVDIMSTQNDLWITGIYTDGTPLVDTPNPDGFIKYYDITTRDAPSLTDEFSIKIGARWTLHRHYDLDTETFIGDPYLVALDATGQTSEQFPLNTLEVIHGYTGAIEGTYSLTGSFDIDTQPYPYLLMCDNIAMVQFDEVLYAIDLFDVTTPALAWSQAAGSRTPTVYLGNNQTYVQGLSRLYTQVNIDDTNVLTDGPGGVEIDPAGFFLDGFCLYRGRDSGFSYYVGVPIHPRLRRQIDAPVSMPVFGIGRSASADVEDSRIYIATQGLAGGISSIAIFSSIV